MTFPGIRPLLLSAAVTAAVGAMLISAAGPASANQSGIEDASTAQIQACRALGGHETVDTEMTNASGHTQIVVSCRGGLLDGLNCFNGHTSGTTCWFTKVASIGGNVAEPEAGIAPIEANETVTSPVEAEAPDDVMVEDTSETPGGGGDATDFGTGTDDPAVDQSDSEAVKPETTNDPLVDPSVTETPASDLIATEPEFVDGAGDASADGVAADTTIVFGPLEQDDDENRDGATG